MSDVCSNSLAPIQSFRDVLAGRSANRRNPGVLWPDFDRQTHARLWRRNRRICEAPAIDEPRAIIDGPAIFVSMQDGHFGHIVAETVPRLPQSLIEGRGLPLYFSAGARMRVADTSRVFRSVLNWLGVAEDRVRLIHQPTLFRDLHVAPQAEHLDGPPPPDSYLALLETITAPRLTGLDPRGVTFVSRAGLPDHYGHHAAEGYLAACLTELGVRVVYPETLPLPDQMRIYAESRALVFSEGSALHGRQLLGRIDQSVSVLRRRHHSTVGRNALLPRCASVDYVPCLSGVLRVTDKTGREIDYALASLYAVEPLIAHFESLGVPLRRVWDMATYRRHRDHDVLSWIRAMYHPEREHWLRPQNTPDYLLDQFEPLGLGHLRPLAAQIIGGPDAHPVPAASAPVLLAIAGDTGVDIVLADRQGRHRCIATRDGGPGDWGALHLHGAGADPARILGLTDALSGALAPGAVHGCTMADRALLRNAWQRVGRVGLHHVTQAGTLTLLRALATDPEEVVRAVRPLHDYNRCHLGIALAQALVPGLAAQIAAGRLSGPVRNRIGYALRLLGDLCTRGGDHALALTCHETSLRAAENPFRRRNAIEAAYRLGDRARLAHHVETLRERGQLPGDLAGLIGR